MSTIALWISFGADDWTSERAIIGSIVKSDTNRK